MQTINIKLVTFEKVISGYKGAPRYGCWTGKAAFLQCKTMQTILDKIRSSIDKFKFVDDSVNVEITFFVEILDLMLSSMQMRSQFPVICHLAYQCLMPMSGKEILARNLK